MKTADLLRAAWAKIDSPEKWIKGSYAKNSDGDNTFTKATCFCSAGALHILELELQRPTGQAFLAIGKAARDLGCFGRTDILKYNDAPETTHDDIKRVWMRAIELAEEEENATTNCK